MVSSRSASETDPGSHVVESSSSNIVESADKSSLKPDHLPSQEHLEYFRRLFGDAVQSWKAVMDTPQGPISLSDTSIPRSQRLADSAPPMSIVQFKEWAAQTGVEMLLIADITLWKSRKTWRHEFIVVTLEPCATFKLRGLDSRLGSFPLVENVKGGLRFRIDRGQRKVPYGSHRAAIDTVELMNRSSELKECDPCFSFHPRTEIQGSDTADFPEMMRIFLNPRVFDVLFCLDRALAALGAEYNLISRNCWHFASFVFQTMVLLFRGFDYNEAYTRGHETTIRRQFYGAKIHKSMLKVLSTPFGVKAMYGVQMDDGLPIHKNPFRSALFFAYAGCLGSLNGHSDLYMIENGALILSLIKFTTLSRELIHSGTASWLEKLLDKHLSKCDCHSSGINEKPDVLAAMVATSCLSMLARDMDVKKATTDLSACICYIRTHQIGGAQVRTTFAYHIFNLVRSRDSHPQGELSAVALTFFIHVLNSAPSDEEQMIAFGAMQIIAMREPQTLRAADGLALAIKSCFVKILPRSTRALFLFFSLLINSALMSQLFVEWGLLKYMLDFLKKKYQAWARHTTTIPSDIITTTGDLLPAIHDSIFYIISLGQTTRGIKALMKTLHEGFKILGDLTGMASHVTSYLRARARAASVVVLMQVTNHVMSNYMASHNLAKPAIEGNGDELLGRRKPTPLASSSSQGPRQPTQRAQKGRTRKARANDGAEAACDIDHTGANKGSQVLETREGPAPLVSSGPRAYWRAMKRGQKDKGHTSRASEGTDAIHDVHRNGSERAKRIRRPRN